MGIVQRVVFGQWRRQWTWRPGLLGVVTWRGVGVHLLVTSMRQGQRYLRRRREGLDQTDAVAALMTRT